MLERKVQDRTKILKGLSVPTLIKIAQLRADEDYAGAYTIIAGNGGFKAVFGQGAPSQAESVPAHDTLKGALVAMLVESPAFAEGTELANVRGA